MIHNGSLGGAVQQNAPNAAMWRGSRGTAASRLSLNPENFFKESMKIHEKQGSLRDMGTLVKLKERHAIAFRPKSIQSYFGRNQVGMRVSRSGDPDPSARTRVYKDMSPPKKEFYKILMEGRLIHGGNPVMRWMSGNVVVDTASAGNINCTKAKSPEKIDGIVAAIMALDRCIRHENTASVYDERGLMVF